MKKYRKDCPAYLTVYKYWNMAVCQMRICAKRKTCFAFQEFKMKGNVDLAILDRGD